MNKVTISIRTESGCDASEGEYELSLTSFSGSLNLNASGGVDDISLIVEAIENDINLDDLPEEGITEATLAESGEWESVFWHKYYRVLTVGGIELCSIEELRSGCGIGKPC